MSNPINISSNTNHNVNKTKIEIFSIEETQNKTNDDNNIISHSQSKIILENNPPVYSINSENNDQFKAKDNAHSLTPKNSHKYKHESQS